MTIGVPPSAATFVEELGRARGGLGVHRSTNPHLARIFPSTDERFEITAGGCSCDLYVEPDDDVATAAEERRTAEKYRRKGWSAARIQRALRAAASGSVASPRVRDAQKAFREAIEALVRRSRSIRLYAHMYSGSQFEEVVTISGHRRLELSEFLNSSFPPDELVEVVAGRAG